jgi:glycosyltransferase involved in cell wall biosynthesis
LKSSLKNTGEFSLEKTSKQKKMMAESPSSTDKTPVFSVIIPSYNHADYIASAIQSVLDQTWKDFELIVVDDGSQDNSLDIIAGFTDPRIRLIAQENRGAHAAINHGLHEARGSYLAILNSDDQYLPQRLEKAFQVFQAHPQTGLVSSYIEIIDSHGLPDGIKHGYRDISPWLLEAPERSFRAGSDFKTALLTENYLGTTSNYIFPRSCLQSVGEFLPLRYTHDWDFALRVSHLFPIVLLEEPLVRYRVHPRNTIRENQASMIFEICWILAVHVPQFVSSPAFKDEPPAKRIDQLLNSIYTYNCERVLSVLLLQKLDENQQEALALLDQENPERQKYLDFIQSQITRTVVQASPPLSLYRRIRRKLSPLKAWARRTTQRLLHK